MKRTQEYIQKHRERFLEELLDILKIPSISADPAHVKDMLLMAEALKKHLINAGVDKAEIHSTPGHPILFAEKEVDPLAPTVLIYGHYDVQPPDPLDLWHSKPFDPVIKKTELHPEGAIFARGACDDKGQLFMHIKALESMLAVSELPCNIKFLIEGEEEVGSEHLETFCRENQDKLSCDVILISDTALLARDIPSITTGLRGLSYVEVRVVGANRDLHSGVYGGAVGNPINILARMIAKLQDENHRITIPGFYDRVVELSETERAAINGAPFSLEEYKSDLAIEAVQGEEGYSTLERASTRPTLDVNGIWGGYIGEGAKTVLPSEAHAKISMRLVPNQDPDEITDLFTQYFQSLAPPSVRVEVEPHHGGNPVVTSTDSDEYIAAAKAMELVFGKEPIPARGGGSIPIVALFEEVLGVKSVLMGFGLDSDAIHSPNEHFGVYNFFKGIETIPYFHQFYLESKKG